MNGGKKFFIIFIFLFIYSLQVLPADAEQLKIGVRQLPDELYQITFHSFSYDLILRNVYETLFKLDNDYTIQPLLATGWNISDDNKTWTIRIRQNVRFHNGQELTADNVKRSFDWMIDQAKLRNNRYILSLFETMQVDDKYVVRVMTNYSNANTLVILSRYLPIFLIKAEPFDKFEEIPFGTGPYTFRIEHDGNFLLNRFDEYWGPKPNYESIVFKQISDEKTSEYELLKGEIDVSTDMTYNTYPEIDRSSEHHLTVQNNNISYVLINTNEKPFDDVRVRRALNYAIDRNTINRQVFQDNAVINRGFFSSLTLGANLELTPYEYNTETARNLLRKAGYNGNLETTLYCISSNPEIQQAQMIAQYLDRLNINIKLESLPIGAWLEKYRRADNRGLFFIRKTFYPLATSYFSGYFSENILAGYYPDFKDIKSDLNIATATFDDRERERIYNEIDSKIHSDCPFIFLYTYPSLFTAISNKVNNQAWIAISNAGLNSCDNCYNDPKCKERTDCPIRCCPSN